MFFKRTIFQSDRARVAELAGGLGATQGRGEDYPSSGATERAPAAGQLLTGRAGGSAEDGRQEGTRM